MQQLGSIVSCIKIHKSGAKEQLFGKVVALRISKYNRKQSFCSIQTRCGVYSSSVLQSIKELSKEQISELTHYDLHAKKSKKNAEYKVAKKIKLKALKTEIAAAKKQALKEAPASAAIKGKKKK